MKVEDWARVICQRELDQPVERHDDGSSPGMYDLRIGEVVGPAVAIECDTPPAHQRYMAASGLVGLPPALFRLYRTLGVRWFNPLAQTQASLWLLWWRSSPLIGGWASGGDGRTRCC